MAPTSQRVTDEQIEVVLGHLLRIGVIVVAVVVAIGGILYLARHGDEPAQYSIFRGEPEHLRTLTGAIAGALALEGRAIIMLGLMLLIGIPVARVCFSIFAFAWQRDFVYVVLTFIVFLVLLYSLFYARP